MFGVWELSPWSDGCRGRRSTSVIVAFLWRAKSLWNDDPDGCVVLRALASIGSQRRLWGGEYRPPSEVELTRSPRLHRMGSCQENRRELFSSCIAIRNELVTDVICDQRRISMPRWHQY